MNFFFLNNNPPPDDVQAKEKNKRKLRISLYAAANHPFVVRCYFFFSFFYHFPHRSTQRKMFFQFLMYPLCFYFYTIFFLLPIFYCSWKNIVSCWICRNSFFSVLLLLLFLFFCKQGKCRLLNTVFRKNNNIITQRV
jgi:hypothetical protein